MDSSAYKEHKPAIVFTQPKPLTNEFYNETRDSSKSNLVYSASIIRSTYRSLDAKNTPMESALTFIIENPGKVRNSMATVGIEVGKAKGDAIYSVQVVTEGESKKPDVKIFTLRVGKDSTEVSYAHNGSLVELHRQQKGKGIMHEVDVHMA